MGDVNQYAVTWGAPDLRRAIAPSTAWYGMAVDPEREITVTCGATEAMVSTLLATINPGDEVIVAAPTTRTTGRTASWPGRRPAPFVSR